MLVLDQHSTNIYNDNMTSDIVEHITLTKIASLFTKKWLNDEVLNFNTNMLDTFLPSYNYIVLNSFFADNVIDYKKKDSIKTPKYHEITIKRWLRKHYYNSIKRKHKNDENAPKDIHDVKLADHFKDLEMIIFIRNIEQVNYIKYIYFLI